MTMKRIATQESRSAGVEMSETDHEPPKAVSKLDHLPLKLLRFGAVRERTGLSRSTVWRLERRGVFPRHVKISANIVAWLEEDVVAWIRSRVNGLSA
jgi:prophage regulatory protein